MTPLAAFLGATATIAGVYFLGRREGQLDSSTLLLAGIISASFLSAIIMFLMTTLASRDLRGIAFWLMGDLSTSLPPGLLWILVVGFLLAAGAIFTTASDLNLLLAGEREAMHLGVDVTRVKLVVYVSASVLDRPGRFGQRSHRLRGAAGAARDAHALRLRLPPADPHVGARRRHRHRAGRYAGAHHCRAHRAARRRHDGDGRRAGFIYLLRRRLA